MLAGGEGERHAMGSSSVTIKVGAADTAGTFYCGEAELQPGFLGPPVHVHERLHDVFFVIEGTLTVHLDGEDHEASAGTFICVPPGVMHTFSNRAPVPVRLLNFTTPGGWEVYMRELGAAYADGDLRPQQIGAIASRHDFRVV